MATVGDNEFIPPSETNGDMRYIDIYALQKAFSNNISRSCKREEFKVEDCLVGSDNVLLVNRPTPVKRATHGRSPTLFHGRFLAAILLIILEHTTLKKVW